MEKHTYRYEDGFRCEAGGFLPGLELAYHCSPGGFHGQKVILIFHALTASSDPEAWWPELVGPGRFFDTGKYFVLCCNMLGSCYGSTGPTSINPSTGRPWLLDFPKVTVRDIVRAIDLVRRHLGIEKIDLMIGSSIGGFQALEYAVMFPEVVGRAVFMATLARVTPWLTAFEETQRMALAADPSFMAAKDKDGGKEALKCARAVALLSYRCEDGLNRKQQEEDEDAMFAGRACSYMQHQGDKLAGRFDAYSYWYLSYAVDSNNVGRGRGGVAKALSGIPFPATVVSIDSDLIFPPYEMEEMAQQIGKNGADYHMITSHYGHDGFLLENDQITELVRPLLP